MKTIQTKSGEVLLVKVPEDATWWEITKNSMGEFITKTLDLNQMFLQYGKTITTGKVTSNAVYYSPKNFYLPKGNWKIVGKFSELKDEGFEEFVEWSEFDEGVKQYFNDIQDCWNCKSAKESFQSLCKSQGIEDDLSNYLIIKKL